MPDKEYIDRLVNWAVHHPGALWADSRAAADARNYLRKYAPQDFKALYYAEDDATRNSIDRRFLPNGVEQEVFSQGIRDYTNKAAPYIGGAMAGSLGLAAGLSALPYVPQALQILQPSTVVDKIVTNPIAQRVLPKALSRTLTGTSLTGAKTVAGAMANGAYDVYGSYMGAKDLLSGNGVQKTYNLFKDRNYAAGAKSALGDAVNALGVVGTARGAKELGRRFSFANRGLHTYDSLTPLGYKDPIKRGWKWIQDTYSDVPVDLAHPQWEKEAWNIIDNMEGGRGPGIGASTPELRKQIYYQARQDALALYTGQPQQYGTYIQNPDGTWSYDLDRIKRMDPRFNFNFRWPDKKFDTVTGAAGHLWSDVDTPVGKIGKIRTIKDRWDLNPFSRKDDQISDLIGGKLMENFGTQSWMDRAQRYREAMFNNHEWSLDGPQTLHGWMMSPLDAPLNRYRMNGLGTNKKGELITPADDLVEWFRDTKLTKLNDKARNWEAGKLLGGKPFMMQTDIPLVQSSTGRYKYAPILMEFPK